MAEDTTMNYEKLFDHLREERNNIRLQELPPTFYSDIIEYFRIKGGSSSDQLKNAKRIIEEIYERREKKILNLAISKSRTKSSLIDTSALLPEENILFKQTVILMDHFRDEILKKVISDTPSTDKILIDQITATEEENTTQEIAPKQETKQEEPANYRVKFLKYVDKFVGSNLEIFGPFDEGNVAELPKETADLVISKLLAIKFGED
jgi:DNA replication initiation complex subunit (GINS family)